MCTAIQWNGCFGRNLDLWYSYGESAVFTPRRYPFRFTCGRELTSHHAFAGTAHLSDGFPLYYDAVNEKGLAMAGLNFPGNACYDRPAGETPDGTVPLAPWELIPWILGNFSSLSEVRAFFPRLRIVDIPFRPDLPNTPLHWMIADRESSLVLEWTAESRTLSADPVGVLTNNPPFGYHLTRLTEYMHISPRPPENRFIPPASAASDGWDFRPFSQGMGALGLPGDWSSPSRFVRAAFVRANAVPGRTEEENVSQFFHLLDTAAMPKGSVLVPHGDTLLPEYTLYSCCCSLTRGIYCWKTFDSSRIRAVDMHREDPDGSTVVSYPLAEEAQFAIQN